MNESQKVFCKQLRKTLLNGSSINNPDIDLWSLDNFTNLHNAVNANLKEGSDSFISKITTQILEAEKTNSGISEENQRELLLLVAELLSLYYVFPSNVTKDTKKRALNELLGHDNPIAQGLGLTLDDLKIIENAILAGGIGSGGMGYNTNKQKEMFYLIEVLKSWYELPSEDRDSYLMAENANFRFQNFLDEVANGRSPQIRHALLHLLYPDYYEPIISTTQKWKITQVFSDFYSDEDVDDEWSDDEPLHQTLDQKIKVINKKLAALRGKPTDFYDDELVLFWDSASNGVIPDLDTELLEYKKQVVLYGPPGTSKTYTAKQLAEEVIRYRMAKDIGASILEVKGQSNLREALAENIHRLQLHPAYSYEDFIRGLQFKGGNTFYKKGYLLQLIERMEKIPDLPHVLILDEINRVDLSRLFGECFSALENRGEAIDLLGTNDSERIQLKIPENLYIIGTMNLIDHSVEQLDFALRRRFLWVEASYNPEALLEICKSKWNDLNWESKIFRWELVEPDFELLVNAATNLNESISNEDELGRDFVLGHVFFVETVSFLHQFLQRFTSNPRSFLFTSKGGWREPLEKLWRLSLNPLLKEYLSGLDNKAQQLIMNRLKEAFKP